MNLMLLDDQLFNLWMVNNPETFDDAHKTVVKMLKVCINKLTEIAAKHPEGVFVDEIKKINNSWNLAIAKIKKESDFKKLPEDLLIKYLKKQYPEDAHLLK